MNEVRIVGNDIILSVDEVVANIENAALIEDNKRLQAENAKLRELCKDMYEDIVYGCAECFFPKYSEHSGKPSECDNGGCGYRQIADRMRELGIEVDA